jgi:DNA-directed RNA polymerase specialized sigma24 family protein
MGLSHIANELILKENLWHKLINDFCQGNFLSKQDREDLLQDSYIKFLKSPVYFQDDIHIGFFKKIMYNTIIDFLRRKKDTIRIDDTIKFYDKDFYNLYLTPDYKANITTSILVDSLTSDNYISNKINFIDIKDSIERLRCEEKTLIELYIDSDFNITELCRRKKEKYHNTYRKIKNIFKTIKLETQWD